MSASDERSSLKVHDVKTISLDVAPYKCKKGKTDDTIPYVVTILVKDGKCVFCEKRVYPHSLWNRASCAQSILGPMTFLRPLFQALGEGVEFDYGRLKCSRHIAEFEKVQRTQNIARVTLPVKWVRVENKNVYRCTGYISEYKLMSGENLVGHMTASPITLTEFQDTKYLPQKIRLQSFWMPHDANITHLNIEYVPRCAKADTAAHKISEVTAWMPLDLIASENYDG